MAARETQTENTTVVHCTRGTHDIYIGRPSKWGNPFVIGKDGTIQNLQLVSGHPLLVAAAQEAVKQWQYKPTLLNGEPVEVVTQIDVNFTLSQ